MKKKQQLSSMTMQQMYSLILNSCMLFKHLRPAIILMRLANFFFD